MGGTRKKRCGAELPKRKQKSYQFIASFFQKYLIFLCPCFLPFLRTIYDEINDGAYGMKGKGLKMFNLVFFKYYRVVKLIVYMFHFL